MTQSNEPKSDAAVAAEIARHLNEERLSDDVLARLDRARRAAVAGVQAAAITAPGPWIPLGALTATLLVLGIVASTGDVVTMPAVDDELMFAAAQDRELLEDLEFLAWLDEQDVDHAG